MLFLELERYGTQLRCFHANNSAIMATPRPTAFSRSNSSYGADIVDPIKIVPDADSPYLAQDGKKNLSIILKNRPKIRCKLACKVLHTLSILDFNSPF